MNHLVILLFLLFGAGTLSAQEVRVSVLSDNAPVEDAFLFVNNRYYGSSDSSGSVRIRRSDISAGDTISVSYIGMDGGAVAYSPDNYGPEGITITLHPNFYLSEVVVMAEDKSRQMLNRYVKDRYTDGCFVQYRGDYTICRQSHGEIAGSLVFTLFPDTYAAYYKLNSKEITSTSDTTGISADLKQVILTALNTSLYSVQLKRRYLSTQQMRVKYMGKDNGCYVFSLVKAAFAKQLGSADGFQTMIYADTESGEIVFAKTTVLSSDGQTVCLSADYAAWRPKSSLGGRFIYPTRIEGSIISPQNIKTRFLIENNHMSLYEGPAIPRKDRLKKGR